MLGGIARRTAGRPELASIQKQLKKDVTPRPLALGTQPALGYLRSNFRHTVGQKLLHLGSSKWFPPKQFFAVSSENTDFSKKLFSMKIFSIKFAIKKGYINFWHKMTFFLKKFLCPPQNFFSPCVLTLAHPEADW